MKKISRFIFILLFTALFVILPVYANETETTWEAEDFTYGEVSAECYPVTDTTNITTYSGIGVTGFSDSGLEKVTINPDVVLPSRDTDGNRVVGVGSGAFYTSGTTGPIKSITLPEDAEDWIIMHNAFHKNQITSVDLSGVVFVGNYAFKNNQITSVKFDENIWTIYNGAFAQNAITSVEFPEKTTHALQFDNMSFAINQITSVKIPDNTEKLHKWTFIQNTGVETVADGTTAEKKGGVVYVYANNLDVWNKSLVHHIVAASSNIQRLIYEGPVTEDEGRTYGSGADALAAVTAGTGVIIDVRSTEETDKLYLTDSIKQPLFDSEVTDLRDQLAFDFISVVNDNAELIDKDIYILCGDGENGAGEATKLLFSTGYAMENIITIEKGATDEDILAAFEGQRVSIVAEGNCGATGSDLTWTLYDNGELVISGTGSMLNYSQGAFPWNSYKSDITSVIVEEGVTSISSYAFYNHTSLKTANLPEGLALIDKFAFYGSGLTSVDIPGSLTSAEGAFNHCTKLANVNLADGIKGISGGMFAYCSALETLEIPESVESIGDGVFNQCGNIELYFKGDAPTFDQDAFKNSSVTCFFDEDNLTWTEDVMKGLNSFVIWKTLEGEKIAVSDVLGTSVNYVLLMRDEKMKIFGEGEMKNYSTINQIWNSYLEIIKCVEIEDGVTSIGSYVFSNCINLTDIYMPSSVEIIGDNAFYGLTPSEVTIHSYIGSTAKKYALDNGFKYVGIDENEIGFALQPENQSVAVGETAIFTVEATGIGVTYQWQYSNNNGENWYDSGMTGCKSYALTVPAIAKRNGQMYRCKIVDASGEELLSEVAVLNIVIPVIDLVNQPEDACVEVGENAVFSVEAEGNELSYQWQYSNDGGNYWYDSGMVGSTTNELTVLAVAKRDGQMYRCIVVDSYGTEIISNAAVLTLKEELSITVHPEDQTAFIGEEAKFVVEASQDELSYQWQYSNDGGTYWHNSGLEGNTTTELTVPAIAKRNGQLYRCMVTNANGKVILSDTAKLVVTEAFKITMQPESRVVSIGETAIFNVEVTGDEISYQWQYSNNGGKYWYNSGMDGYDTNELCVVATAKRNGQLYRCVLTDPDGNKVITEEAMLTVGE